MRGDECGIDGMVYPSTVVRDGQNVVVFSLKNRWVDWGEIVELVATEHLIIDGWQQLKGIVLT